MCFCVFFWPPVLGFPGRPTKVKLMNWPNGKRQPDSFFLSCVRLPQLGIIRGKPSSWARSDRGLQTFPNMDLFLEQRLIISAVDTQSKGAPSYGGNLSRLSRHVHIFSVCTPFGPLGALCIPRTGAEASSTWPYIYQGFPGHSC